MSHRRLTCRTIAFASVGLCAVALLLAGAGCDSAQRVTDADVQTIGYEELRELQRDAEAQSIVLIDVRSPADYRQGHIPGAVNIPLPELQRSDARLSGEGWLIVYADDWETGLATAAAKKLVTLGYANVYEYRDGFRRWQDEGGEVAGNG